MIKAIYDQSLLPWKIKGQSPTGVWNITNVDSSLTHYQHFVKISLKSINKALFCSQSDKCGLSRDLLGEGNNRQK